MDIKTFFIVILLVLAVAFMVNFIMAQLSRAQKQGDEAGDYAKQEAPFDPPTLPTRNHVPHNPIQHNAGKPWTEDQMNTLASLINDGVDVNEVAYIMGRSLGAVKRRISLLNQE